MAGEKEKEQEYANHETDKRNLSQDSRTRTQRNKSTYETSSQNKKWYYSLTKGTYIWLLLLLLEGLFWGITAINNNHVSDVSTGVETKRFVFDEPYNLYSAVNRESKEFFGQKASTLDDKLISNCEEASFNKGLVSGNAFFSVSDTVKHKPYVVAGTIIKKYRLGNTPNLVILDDEKGEIAVYYVDELPSFVAGSHVEVVGLVMGSYNFDGKPVIAVLAKYQNTKLSK